jgi:hypothetical protein
MDPSSSHHKQRDPSSGHHMQVSPSTNIHKQENRSSNQIRESCGSTDLYVYVDASSRNQSFPSFSMQGGPSMPSLGMKGYPSFPSHDFQGGPALPSLDIQGVPSSQRLSVQQSSLTVAASQFFDVVPNFSIDNVEIDESLMEQDLDTSSTVPKPHFYSNQNIESSSRQYSNPSDQTYPIQDLQIITDVNIGMDDTIADDFIQNTNSQHTVKKRRIERTAKKDGQNFPMQMKRRTNLNSHQQQSSSEDSIFNCPSGVRNLAAPTGFNSGRSSDMFNHQIQSSCLMGSNEMSSMNQRIESSDSFRLNIDTNPTLTSAPSGQVGFYYSLNFKNIKG